MECMDMCGGCASLENCDDGVCDEAEGENCENCPGDCPCPDELVCYKGICCETDCEGKECGDDGCGGECGECGPGFLCGGQGLCGEIPTCEVIGGIHCDEAVEGDTTGHKNLLEDYSDSPGSCFVWSQSGPEVAYEFFSVGDDEVTAELEYDSWSIDLDVLVTESACS